MTLCVKDFRIDIRVISWIKMDNSDTPARKPNKQSIAVLLLPILLVLFVFIFLFKNSILNFLNPRDKDEISTGYTNNEESKYSDISPFSNFVSESTSSNINRAYDPEVRNYLDLAERFELKMLILQSSSSNNGDVGSILEDNQVVADVVNDENGIKSYKLVASKNPSIKYNTGEFIKFKPSIIKPEALVVSDGETMKFKFEDGDFKDFEDDILDVGDRFVFTCQKDSCEDGVLSWVFVLKNQLNN
ncbi:MAG TPA: hypothetical protein PLW49_02190 [bacterium]|nr:hypothetical protein [bacterium]